MDGKIIKKRRIDNDNTIYAASKRFTELHNATKITQHFVVPQGDSEWDAKFWGMHLGANIYNVLHENSRVNLFGPLTVLGFKFQTKKSKKATQKSKTSDEGN